MKRLLLLISTISAMVFTAVASAQEQGRTLKSEMEYIHESLDANFVYDSEIVLDMPYSGKPMSEIINGSEYEKTGILEECLSTLFSGSGIKHEQMKRYVVLTYEAKRKKPKNYNILVEEQHDTIDEAFITAIIDARRNSTQTGLKRINNKILNSGFAFFSTPDVIKTLQLLPGVSSGTELLSGIYVHGGDGSDNLFLLDGVPIYQSSHLLGLFSAFNCDVISNMDFYKSGFPARYGTKMSSVVDITTKDGDYNEYHGLFSLGLIDGRFQLEGPVWKDKTSFNIALRRTWTETVTWPMIARVNKDNAPNKANYRYAFTDLNTKITHKFNDKNVLSANFYIGNDVLKSKSEDYYDFMSTSGVMLTARELMDIDLGWGNTLASLNWNFEINEDVSITSKMFYTGSFSNLGYSDEQFEGSRYNLTRMAYNNGTHTAGLKSDLFHTMRSKHKLRYGIQTMTHFYRPDYFSKVEEKNGNKGYVFHPYLDSLEYNAVEASVYGEDEIAVNEALSVNAGLRYTLYHSSGKTCHSLEPRIAMKYAINDQITTKVSYTEMSQPSHLVSSLHIDLPTNIWLPSTSEIRPSRSREVAAGLYSNISPSLHINLEGWYKHMYNIIEYAGPANLFPLLSDWEKGFKPGQGRSWGAELDFGYSKGRTEVNVYYTLSWTQRRFDDFYRDWYRDRNDNRHKITLMSKHKFSRHFEMYGAWNYHSGNRVTLASHMTPDGVNVYLEPNNVKLPDYHRLDVGMNFIRTTKRGNTGIWNLSVYNAYCRLNPIAAFSESQILDDKVVASYASATGIIPIIPTFSYTLKF